MQDNPFITETLSAEKQVAWHEAGTRKRLARTSIGHHYSVWAAPNIWTCQYQIFEQTTTKIWTASGQIAGFDNTEYLDLIIVWSWHSQIQGVFLTGSPLKCWRESNRFQINLRVPDCPQNQNEFEVSFDL